MKYLLSAGLCALLLLSLAPSAVGQHAKKDYSALVEVGSDPDTGALLATSKAAAEASQKSGYSTATTRVLAFWIEARKPETGPVKVVIAGERLTLMTAREAPKGTEFGPSDPKDPVFVGDPWMEADVRYRGATLACLGDGWYCNFTTFLEIDLPDAVIRKVLDNASVKDIPLALTSRRKVDWRVPREELVAVLDRIGALAELGGGTPR